MRPDARVRGARPVLHHHGEKVAVFFFIFQNLFQEESMEQPGSTETPPASARIDERIAGLGDWRGETLRRIRTLIEIGQLPALVDRRSWIGQGHGEACALCDQPITAAHWEHEVDIMPRGEIRAHGVCFRIWGEESEQLRKTA